MHPVLTSFMAEPGTPIRCPECRALLGKLVRGFAFELHHGKASIASAIWCDRRGCEGSWSSSRAVMDLLRERMGSSPTLEVAVVQRARAVVRRSAPQVGAHARRLVAPFVVLIPKAAV